MLLLRSRSRTAAEGRGGVVLVTGPAGIGKTRLVEEALRPDARSPAIPPAGASTPAPVGRGYCVADHAAPALWPWQQALLALTRGGGGPAGIAAALDLLGAAGRQNAPGDAASAASSRFAALAAVADAVLTAATVPLVIVLEDLHWADTNSVELLRQVAGGIVDSQLMLIATLRTLPDEASNAVGELSRLDSVDTVPLLPLTAAAIREYLTALDPAASFAARAGEVARRSGGLPLLLDAAARDTDSPGTVAVRDLVATLLAQLPTSARRVVQVAALLRPPVDAELVGRVAEVDESTAGMALDAACRAGLLARATSSLGVEGQEFAFTHGLLADGLTDLLDPVERRGIHRRAAVTLQARPATVPGLAAEVTRHWRGAGGDEEAQRCAARWARQAAAESIQASAYDEAASHLRTAVAALRQAGAGDAELAETTLELARSCYLAGALAKALQQCEQTAAAAGRAGRADLTAAAALVMRWVDFPQATEAIPRLCRVALATPQPAHLRSQLLSQLATALGEAGSTEAARQHVDEAMEVARASGDAQALLDAARTREMALDGPDDAQERLRMAATAIEQADRLGQPLSAVLGQQWKIRAAYQLGRLDLVDEAMTAVAALADRSGLPLARWHRLRGVAARAALEGRFAAARSADLEARRLGSRAGDAQSIGLSYAFAAHLAALRGDATELPDDYWPALEAFPPSPLMTVNRANGLLLEGRREEALAWYERLRWTLGEPVVGTRGLGVLMQLIDLVEAFGDPPAAEALAAQLKPYAAYPGAVGGPTVFFIGSMQGHYGRALAHAGELRDAEAALRAAIAQDAALGARAHVVLGRLALAGVLRRLDDPDAAAAVAGAAAAEARRLDMAGPLARADRLLADLAAARRAADPLTPREHEVAALVVQAMSNREIAARLVLSERTVESHIRSILAKLGYTNRTELVARWRA